MSQTVVYETPSGLPRGMPPLASLHSGTLSRPVRPESHKRGFVADQAKAPFTYFVTIDDRWDR